jgi:hypothetical protein
VAARGHTEGVEIFSQGARDREIASPGEDAYLAGGSQNLSKADRLVFMRRCLHARVRRLTLLGLGITGLALLLSSCGKTGSTFGGNAAGTHAAGGATAGSSTGTAGGGVPMTSAGRTSDAGSAPGGNAGRGGGGGGGASGANGGGGPAAGVAGIGGTGGMSVGEAGAGGMDPQLGVDCRNTHCATGDVCVSCGMPQGAEWLCAPHPVTSPQAYATAIASCSPAPYGYNECDGPEDCASDQYCVSKEGDDGRQRCRSTPAPGHCCFTCNALVDCTLCRDDGDCPDGESCSVVYDKLKGCTKK